MKKNKEKLTKTDRKKIKAKILAVEKELLELSDFNNRTKLELRMETIVEMQVKTQLYSFIAAENLFERYKRHVNRSQIGY